MALKYAIIIEFGRVLTEIREKEGENTKREKTKSVSL